MSQQQLVPVPHLSADENPKQLDKLFGKGNYCVGYELGNQMLPHVPDNAELRNILMDAYVLGIAPHMTAQDMCDTFQSIVTGFSALDSQKSPELTLCAEVFAQATQKLRLDTSEPKSTASAEEISKVIMSEWRFHIPNVVHGHDQETVATVGDFLSKNKRLLVTKEVLAKSESKIAKFTNASSASPSQQAAPQSDMRLVFLGTASAQPAQLRNVSSFALSLPSSAVWLFDCGEGTQHQLMKSQLKFTKIEKIFITHLHGDHMYGIFGLLCTLSGQNVPNKERIHIYGPVGTRRMLQVVLGLSEAHVDIGYCVHELIPQVREDCSEDQVNSVQEVQTSLATKTREENMEALALPALSEVACTGDIFQTRAPSGDAYWNISKDAEYEVTACAVDHTVYSVGFVITEAPKPGKLDDKKLKAMLEPHVEALMEKEGGKSKNPRAFIGQACGKVKAGQSIELPDGTSITPEDVVGEPIKGRRVIILGDTSNSDGLIRCGIAENADVVVHECTLSNDMAACAEERGHSTPAMAGEFAQKLKTKSLCLTHFSQRFPPQSYIDYLEAQGEPKGDDVVSPAELVEHCKAVYSGDVVAAEDFTTVHVFRDRGITTSLDRPKPKMI
eukprot:GFYU01008294.1.p1 GENE.GFYU01008294.1~~GFYU01008294.1.p1  ORF type:complete len:615 (-),score=138.90 GFYU01008294.1:120-1964(-)